MPWEINLPDGFRFEYANVMADRLGRRGLNATDVEGCPGVPEAAAAMARLRREGRVDGHDEPVHFTRLPFQERDNPRLLGRVESWAAGLRGRCDTLVSLGIGGSYLGGAVLVEALGGGMWNLLPDRGGWPRVLFSGNNVDPASLTALDRVVDPARTMFMVISKSGTTTETMAAFLHFHERVRRLGLDPARHFTAVTDPVSGILRRIADRENWPAFDVPPGVGGRWSVLSDAGLLTAAAIGAPIRTLLAGARSMEDACQGEDVWTNPALLYAALCTLLYQRHGIHESVLMPYADGLRSFALWYVQLLAESLGKERNRRGEPVHEGRTPIPALGTTDMHAQTQQHREGKRNKLVTTISVESFGPQELVLPTEGGWAGDLPFVAGRPMSRLLDAARRANEDSLAADGRPSCCLVVPRLDAYTLGQLFHLFELATAYEGELLNVNAFDQPGVEHYKKLMRQMLG